MYTGQKAQDYVFLDAEGDEAIELDESSEPKQLIQETMVDFMWWMSNSNAKPAILIVILHEMIIMCDIQIMFSSAAMLFVRSST